MALGRAGEPGVLGSLEPVPLEKKQEPAPKPCDKIKSIRKLYFSYSSLGK